MIVNQVYDAGEIVSINNERFTVRRIHYGMGLCVSVVINEEGNLVAPPQISQIEYQ